MSFDKSKKPLLNKAAFCFAYIKNIYDTVLQKQIKVCNIRTFIMTDFALLI